MLISIATLNNHWAIHRAFECLREPLRDVILFGTNLVRHGWTAHHVAPALYVFLAEQRRRNGTNLSIGPPPKKKQQPAAK